MASDDKSLVVEAFLEENSFARIICFSNKKSLVKHNSVCEKNSRFEAVNFSTNELVADSVSRLKDDASCLIINSYLNKGVDSNIKDKVIHVGENNSSLISSRSYLLNSKSDSRGLIRIEPSAFNAQGFQESNSLIEGDSRFISVPDLEILNNEVKCSHGSTISRIKDEDLFYFESRGISKDEARKMLISGHVLGVLPSSQIKDFANDLLIDFLRGVSS
jgi:Fe-S cluster assembly scaffold protein SufB